MTFLALDIGGTKLAVRAVKAGRTWERIEPWPRDGVESDLALLRDVLTALPSDVVRAGVSAAPTVDSEGHVTAWPSRPSWCGLDLRRTIEETVGAPVLFGDDGTLAAVAEAEVTGCADLVYLGLGTGVGGGVVSDGRLIRGAWGNAGELGHLPMDPAGPPCRCGRGGCLQALLSPEALSRRTGLSPKELAASGQVAAFVADVLARVVVLLSELVQPSRVHLGGGFGVALPGLPARVEERSLAWSRRGHRLPAVATAVFGAHASLAGAMVLARTGETGLRQSRSA
ncbi:ROK family protein [Amycolatopsis alba]|uniref:Kanamycin kinase n=1 Tax=Amycolatopsis alba DSM 44262 TaxID=1125972 RepID=A0A229S7A6_AMYAL|nr:ROK family protein [Amycolatopsis alba]OXM54569.1 kanamycin kinase [Amycolatopsis alba DSM 44262]